MIAIVEGLFLAGLKGQDPGEFRSLVDAGVFVEQGGGGLPVGFDEFTGEPAADVERHFGGADQADVDLLEAKIEEKFSNFPTWVRVPACPGRDCWRASSSRTFLVRQRAGHLGLFERDYRKAVPESMALR
jgi:hypothetical protein